MHIKKDDIVEVLTGEDKGKRGRVLSVDAEANKVFSNLVPKLMRLSKCPDYIINRGHYFGTSYFKEEPALSDADKRALIEYLKTF